MKLNKSVCLLFIFALIAAFLAGCTTTKRMLGLTNKIDISIETTKDVNPDAQGMPSPIVVRFYELSTAIDFRKADYEALFNNEQASIGKDIIRRDEFELKPEQTRNIVRKAKRETKYLALLAAYHNTANIKWRAVMSVNSDGTTRVALRLEKSGITVAQD
ncbi:type VI secretion system lipoprotein TssJ [Kaarinaea lacus]